MWPRNVHAEKVFLPTGCVAYALRHDELGKLGRILLQPVATGGMTITYEVIDLPDGRFAERADALAHLALVVTEALSRKGK